MKDRGKLSARKRGSIRLENAPALRRKSILLSLFLTLFASFASTAHTEKTSELYVMSINQFIRVCGDMPMHKVSAREIDYFLSRKTSEASVWTARSHYIALSSVFETARRWGYVTENPFRQVQRPRVPEVQPTFFTKDDLPKLFQSIDDVHFKRLCQFAVYTGMRQGEILHLKWSQVDCDRRVIHVCNSTDFTTKTKRNRLIPMNDAVWDLLKHTERLEGCEYVFHNAGKQLKPRTVSKKLKRHIRALGLNDRLHFHSFRHTFATWLIQADVSVAKVQRLLGHADVATTMIYTHVKPEGLHAEVNKLLG